VAVKKFYNFGPRWCLAIKHNFFQYFPTHYPMSLTMLVGSAIGGATSEGGGAVAFPVMTLVLKLAPAIARDFSLMVQSCGNIFTTIHITIYLMKKFIVFRGQCYKTFYGRKLRLFIIS
jgi:hypothetical protein